jgi:putative ABC transport system ATP-binding protein
VAHRSNDDASPAVDATDLTKTYGAGETAVYALRGISFRIAPGTLNVLLGPSGSGKTTCLNLLGAIEVLTKGKLVVDGTDVAGLDIDGQTDYRRRSVGFVFQFFNLVPTLTALENVQLIAELDGTDAEARSREALRAVSLADRADHFPGQLSGGEQQRVAIARALVKNPPLLLCDEPTGSLDLDTGRQVLALLRDAATAGRTIVVVTHNSVIAEMADRVLYLRDGQLVSDEQQTSPKQAEELHW